MANTKSALKRVRQTERRTEINKATKSRIKTLRKKVAAAVEGGDKEVAETAFRAFSSAVDRAAKTNLLHKNAAARLKSNASATLAKQA